MPSPETTRIQKVRNVQGELTDLPKDNPTASISSKIRSLLLKATGTPQLAYRYGVLEANETLTLDSGENACQCLGSNGTDIFAGLYTSPGKIAKIDSTFTKESTLTLDSGENMCLCIALDEENAYVGLNTSPAKIVKIRLSDFTKVSTLTLNAGENICNSLVIDGTHMWAGLETTPAKIVQITLSNFSRDSCLDLSFNNCYGLEIDNAYMYATGGAAGTSGSIAKIDRDTFTVDKTITLISCEQQAYAPFIDKSYLYVVAYAGVAKAPKVVKIDLERFVRITALQFGTAGSKLFSMFSDGTYLNIGSNESPAKIHKVDIRSFSLYATETLAAGENHIGTGMHFDSTYMYAGLYGCSPAKIVRRYIIPPSSNLVERKIDKIYEQEIEVREIYDDFNDDTKNTNVWEADAICGATTIAETGGILQIVNNGGGTACYGWRPTAKNFGKSMEIKVDIKVIDGEAGVDGELCDAHIKLHKDDDNYFRFGLYRHTTTAVNERGLVRYKIDGVSTTDHVDATNIDNTEREYKIIVDEHFIRVYLDRVLLGTYAFEGLDLYEVRLQAGTELDPDKIDISFDNFLVRPYHESNLQIEGIDANYTATRAGYLDYLNSDSKYLHTTAIGTPTAYAIADILKISATEKLKNFIAKTGGTEIGASKSIADYLGDYSGGGDIKTDLSRNQNKSLFPSDLKTSITIPVGAATQALPSVTIPTGALLSGATIDKVYCYFLYGSRYSAGDSKVNAEQHIQVAESVAAVYTNTIKIIDDAFWIDSSEATMMGGGVVFGNIEVSSTVAAENKTYNFRWLNANMETTAQTFYDVQTIIEVRWH